jgi:glycosyltransferase involved in cell wall biosynthesis
MNTNNKVSIIIPSYNHCLYIEESINSCIEQDYPGTIEIIIVDDNSTDDTRKVLEKYKEKKLHNREIKIFLKKDNSGLNNSIEIAFQHSTGEFIQLLASDDYLDIKKIRKQLHFLHSNALDGVYSKVYSISGNKTITEISLNNFKENHNNNKAYEYICKQDFDAPLLQSGLFHKNLMQETMKIRRDFKSDDWAFAIYVFEKYKIGYLDEPLVYYRLHEDNTHNKYFVTFPMRIDVISRLVPEKFQAESLGNIFFSQAAYLFNDKKNKLGMRFFISALVFNPSIVKYILKQYIRRIKRKIYESIS